jgi:hypothetical protein
MLLYIGTQDIQQVEFSLDGQKMILIDTPDFDDTTHSDIEILQSIGLYLQQGFKEFLTGVIYMQRITNNRMTGSTLRNLQVLKELCGISYYPNVALVTSQWDKVPPAIGENRESQLIEMNDYWREMIRQGATIHRYWNSKESAIQILRQFLLKPSFELQFQKELITTHGNIGDTEARKEVVQTLLKKLHSYEEQISKLIEDNRRAEIKKQRMDYELYALREDMQRLKQDREAERAREEERERYINDSLKLKKRQGQRELSPK